VTEPEKTAPLNAHWYAVQTRYQCERRVTAALQQKGLETFLPLFAQTRRWSDRQKRLEVPLFSGYTFTRFDCSSRLRRELLQTSGVVGLLSFGPELPAVPDKQIADLRMLTDEKDLCSLRSFLKAGQRVRVRGGSLDGVEGILEQNSETGLVISILCIQRSIAVKIEGYDLELI